ncbi:sensor histidine kinase [Nocardioides sp. zg-DK7169]|uniref:sensor histidine kinase n=1 Tax=Nocardioides sp. zg-DK7169 TaxID=2736600 RepID=UPI001552FD7C|nr:histidine kinase [Nocardioides sp. zg-DK7169]NPC97184.1 hypothetical protein [Nocardioides sp. zg-DK7169]
MSASAPAPHPLDDWRRWAPDLAVGALAVLVGMLEVLGTEIYPEESRTVLTLYVLGFAAAAGLSRHAPAIALALVWLLGVAQVVTETRMLLVELAVMLVAFGCARWGRPATVWASALSIPVGGLVVFLVAVWFADSGVVYTVLRNYQGPLELAYSLGDTWQVAIALVVLAVLAVPWLAGLALRFLARARDSRASQVVAEDEAAMAVREREQAEEIARLRDEQTRLARDVHDVVGHSLAVILAQAESAQYLPDADTTALKQTMSTIATSARSSLQDVRQVLTSTQAPVAAPGGLDELVEGVRAAGHDVVATEVGVPRPMPPELETVAFRVLQEMLTNAIRHGRRDTPVQVERHWDGELRIEVRNSIAVAAGVPDEDLTRPIGAVDPDAAPPAAPGAGRGLEGMRRRLEAVGGRLDVRRREEAGGPTFTATAWVPTRGLSR